MKIGEHKVRTTCGSYHILNKCVKVTIIFISHCETTSKHICIVESYANHGYDVWCNA